MRFWKRQKMHPNWKQLKMFCVRNAGSGQVHSQDVRAPSAGCSHNWGNTVEWCNQADCYCLIIINKNVAFRVWSVGFREKMSQIEKKDWYRHFAFIFEVFKLYTLCFCHLVLLKVAWSFLPFAMFFAWVYLCMRSLIHREHFFMDVCSSSDLSAGYFVFLKLRGVSLP